MGFSGLDVLDDAGELIPAAAVSLIERLPYIKHLKLPAPVRKFDKRVVNMLK